MINPPQKIDGMRICLQKPEASFELANQFYKIIDKNRNHLLPWLDWAMPELTKSAEDTLKTLLKADETWKNASRFEYFIYSTDENKFLGGVSVIHKGERKRAKIEFAYWLTKEHCGKGYIQEAVKLLEPIFWDLGIQRMAIRCDVDNVSSAKTIKALGYQFEGVARHDRWSIPFNSYRDSNIYSKIKGE